MDKKEPNKILRIDYLNEEKLVKVLDFLFKKMNKVLIHNGGNEILEVVPSKNKVIFKHVPYEGQTKDVLIRAGILEIENIEELYEFIRKNKRVILDTSSIFCGLHLIDLEDVVYVIPRVVLSELFKKRNIFSENLLHEIKILDKKKKILIKGDYSKAIKKKEIDDLNIIEISRDMSLPIVTMDSLMSALAVVEGLKVFFPVFEKIPNSKEKVIEDINRKITHCLIELSFVVSPLTLEVENDEIKIRMNIESKWIGKRLDDWEERRVKVSFPEIIEIKKSKGLLMDKYYREIANLL